jgi:hypothetical protein
MTSMRARAEKLINELTQCEPYCTDCIESVLLDVRNEAFKQGIESIKCTCKYKPYTHQYVFTCDRCEALKQTPGEMK